MEENTQSTVENKSDSKPQEAGIDIWKPFKHPAFNVICGIVGILSFILAFYFYEAAKVYPQLVVYFHPVKATIVKAGQASDIKTFYKDIEINTDVTVAQVAIWNQGKTSIRNENILKPLILFTENGAPILEATIRKSTRQDVTKLNVNSDDIQNGRLPVSWNILEQNDGGVIQIIYAGDSQINFKFEGVVEGQREIEKLTPTATIKSPEEQFVAPTNQHYTWSYIFSYVWKAFIGFWFIIAMIFTVRDMRDDWKTKTGVSRYVFIVLNLFVVIFILAVITYNIYHRIYDPNLTLPFAID